MNPSRCVGTKASDNPPNVKALEVFLRYAASFRTVEANFRTGIPANISDVLLKYHQHRATIGVFE